VAAPSHLPEVGRRPCCSLSAGVPDARLCRQSSSGCQRVNIGLGVARTKYHVMLHSIFRRAVRDGLILTNPCEHTELPKVLWRRSRTLTPEEFDQLIQAVPERHRLMVETASKPECAGAS
jgi:hypothetical protein